jgi:hypothetical protein
MWEQCKADLMPLAVALRTRGRQLLKTQLGDLELLAGGNFQLGFCIIRQPAFQDRQDFPVAQTMKM